MKTQKKQEHPLNPGEAKVLKATIERLSRLAARQALLGIVNVMSAKTSLSLGLFGEIVDDAWRLAQLTEKKGASTIEYALLVVGIAAACALAVGILGDAVIGMFKAAAGLFQYLR